MMRTASSDRTVLGTWLDPDNYKRNICKYWQTSVCNLGENCTFAHGTHELKGSAALGQRLSKRRGLDIDQAASGLDILVQ